MAVEIKKFLECDPGKRNRFEELDIQDSGLYCGRDNLFCHKLIKKQQRLLRAGGFEKAYKLLHDGSIAFGHMEEQGIRIDLKQALTWEKEWAKELAELKESILTSKEAVKFEHRKGRKPNYKKKLSGKDMQVILYDILKLEPVRKTKKGYSVDEEVLLKYADKSEFITKELKARKLEKMLNTYLANFLKYQVDGFLYPEAHLHTARSYRSSYSSPNFQNVIRHSEGKIIRKLVIPRKGRNIETVDYGSMEVRIIACVTNDRLLTEYIVAGEDMHADIGSELFFGIKPDYKWFGLLRQVGKNSAVFPWFYGSYYGAIAKDIWKDLEVWKTGIFDDFYPSLSKRRRYEKWEAHVQDVENWFWGEYKGVRKWQEDYYDEYKRQGFVRDLAWGFTRSGYLKKNEVFNFPIQGPAFHCLLWCIIQIVEGIVSGRYTWNSQICAEIHDDMFWDMFPSESKTIRKEVTRIMTEDVREANPWITVPLAAEWKRGKNWYEMEDIKEA